MIVTAHARLIMTLDPRPLSTAINATPDMNAARTTDGDAPANSVYATIATSVTMARRRRPTKPRRRAATVAATMAMFQPEIATMWLTPAAVKDAARLRSTRSRSPMRIASARPPSGSGSTFCRASPEAWRTPSRRPMAESSWLTRFICVASQVAAIP